MFDEFLKKAEELRGRDEPFAVATVVRSEPPVSGKPGDRAIIRADRSIWGWIGGGCAQPTVIMESLRAISDGKPRLIRISPASQQAEEGVVAYKMECHSGGALDIYIEPVLPKPALVIIGRSPVARTLAKLALNLEYAVTVISPLAATDAFPVGIRILTDASIDDVKTTPKTYVVVSTQGEDDEEGVELALGIGASYTGFVASRTKGEKVIGYLREKGLSPDLLERVKYPAGLDIGAASPEEIALSILAEIVKLKSRKSEPESAAALHDNRKPPSSQAASFASTAPSTEVKDPVCGMTVDVGSARHRSEYQSTSVYFCCARCKESFDKDPARFAARA